MALLTGSPLHGKRGLAAHEVTYSSLPEDPEALLQADGPSHQQSHSQAVKSSCCSMAVKLDDAEDDPPPSTQFLIACAILSLAALVAVSCLADARGLVSMERQRELAGAAINPCLLASLVLALVLALGAWQPRSTGTSYTSAFVTSCKKLPILVGVISTVGSMYTDFTLDVAVLDRYRKHGQIGYFSANLSGIISGLLCAAVFAVQSQVAESSWWYRPVLFIGAATQVLPAVCLAWALHIFYNSPFATVQSNSFEVKLRDSGVLALLAASAAGEGLGEAIMTGIVQMYSVVHDLTLFEDPIVLVSMIMGAAMLAKTMASIDARGNVSRYLGAQPILSGVAKKSSAAFLAVATYRLASISSRMLLFSLINQILHEEVQVFGLACAGILLWCFDLLLEAFWIWRATQNLWKLVYCVPNSLSPMEPLLLPGGPYLSTNSFCVALTHTAEACFAAIVVLGIKGQGGIFASLHHPWLFLVFFAVAIAVQWWLLFMIKFGFAMDDATGMHDMSVVDALHNKAHADAADRRVPMAWTAATSYMKLSDTACKLEEAIRCMQTYPMIASLQQKALVSLRVATFFSSNDDDSKKRIVEDNEKRIAELGGIQAVRRAMEQHTSVAGVQEQACGALRNLGVNA
eukprot:TRINITY_DN8431_c0_g1_i3.p1 TRINITY_DN8431_c0_g1~~TRINITY_DN8431_c0_g1_i3.p1  ORF type:complete len:631 (+),score=116.24 TRINITY_DN8431_c0_g1_i3:50-1942(+)